MDSDSTLLPTYVQSHSRRGALLLLVLSMLTLFLMIGTLMLVLATRARTTARAFADVVSDGGAASLTARELLDEALMVFLRGRPALPPPPAPSPAPPESILADLYGNATLQGSISNLAGQGTPVLQATVNINASDLAGRVLTIKPQPSDPAPIQSFRILAANGAVLDLANLRTVDPFRTFPTKFPCEVYVNGRDFSDEPYDPTPWDPTDRDFRNEPWDANDLENDWLRAPPAGNTPEVDNDGDGILDGVWLSNVLPPQPDGRTARVSFLVRDLDGCINVNAHGSTAAPPRMGPASVDLLKLFDAPVPQDLVSGFQSPASLLPPSASQRRARPGLGGQVDGRHGGGQTAPYGLRLDFAGPRLGTLRSTIANVFTAGELERVLRQFDADASALTPRLAAILGDSAEGVRLLITTDSWDTCGLVGAAARQVATADRDRLAPEVREGLRFDLNRDLADDAAKQAFFDELMELLRLVGGGRLPGPEGDPPTDPVAQWVANLIDFADTDQQPGQYGPAMTRGVEPSSIKNKDQQPTFPNWDTGFQSTGELLGVPRGSEKEISDAIENDRPLTPSLAVAVPEILDAVAVDSLFKDTVFATVGTRRLSRWREPGRVNVNTCVQDPRLVKTNHDAVWKAMAGPAGNRKNPFDVDSVGEDFQGSPAQSMGDILLYVPEPPADPEPPGSYPVFTGQFAELRDPRALNRELANRLANIATCRSNVFAVWITLDLVDPDIRGGQPSRHRLFAIVDRSVPVGFSIGRDLNVRDAIRILRYLE